jgi:hypothetical protein
MNSQCLVMQRVVDQNIPSIIASVEHEILPSLTDKASVADLTTLQTAVQGKASVADLTTLQAAVQGKASIVDLATLQAVVQGKASVADLTTLQTTVEGKASIADLSTVRTAVDTKASTADLSSLQTTVQGKASIVDLATLQASSDDMGMVLGGLSANGRSRNKNSLEIASIGDQTIAAGEPVSFYGPMTMISGRVSADGSGELMLNTLQVSGSFPGVVGAPNFPGSGYAFSVTNSFPVTEIKIEVGGWFRVDYTVPFIVPSGFVATPYSLQSTFRIKVNGTVQPFRGVPAIIKCEAGDMLSIVNSLPDTSLSVLPGSKATLLIEALDESLAGTVENLSNRRNLFHVSKTDGQTLADGQRITLGAFGDVISRWYDANGAWEPLTVEIAPGSFAVTGLQINQGGLYKISYSADIIDPSTRQECVRGIKLCSETTQTMTVLSSTLHNTGVVYKKLAKGDAISMLAYAPTDSIIEPSDGPNVSFTVEVVELY